MKSRILKKLTDVDLSILTKERDESCLEWGKHYLHLKDHQGPLSHGKTLYLYAINIKTLIPIADQRGLFPHTIRLLSEWTGNPVSKLGRAYWHSLAPGERIDCHRDEDSLDTDYFKKIVRYHIYPPISHGFEVVMDSELWNHHEDKMLSQTLLLFNHSDWHYYANHSHGTMSFLVVDFFKN